MPDSFENLENRISKVYYGLEHCLKLCETLYGDVLDCVKHCLELSEPV